MSLQISSEKHSDPEAILYLQEAVKDENLIQLILHAHFLIERAITKQITDKRVRLPKKPTFRKKLDLYVDLIKPPESQKRLLLAFNSLRNKIAHGFQDEAKCVRDCLPWEGEQESRGNTRTHVLMVALKLLIDLGAIDATKIS